MTPSAAEPWAGSLVDALLAARDTTVAPSRRESGARVVHAQLSKYAKRFGLDGPELVAQAWVRALTRPIALLTHTGDDTVRERELKSWLKTVVTNLAMDTFRRRKRDRDREEKPRRSDDDGPESGAGNRIDELPSPTPDDGIDEEEAAVGQRALRAVRSAFERARIDCIDDTVRTDFDAAWGEVTALVEGETTVDVLLGAHVGSKEFVRRRDALYKRHERARKRVLAACAELEATAELPAEDLAHARAAIEGYFKRRQIRSRDASKGAKA